MSLDVFQIIMFLIRAIPTIIVLFILVSLFGSLQVTVLTQDNLRLSIELADNLMSSDLTVDDAVFDREELERLSENDDGSEPFARSCRLGYRASVSLLDTSLLEGFFDDPEWEFGYESDPRLSIPDSKPIVSEFPASVHVDTGVQADFYGDSRPAKFVLTTIDDYLTRSGCMVERAHDLKEVQELGVGCVLSESEISGVATCGFGLKKITENGADKICFFGSVGVINCRDFPRDIEVQEFRTELDFGDPSSALVSGETKTIRFVPLKSPGQISDCENVEDSPIVAGEDDNVAAVGMCVA